MTRLSSNQVPPRKGFTLIELLIVIAIILILIAIALPNFLEAQLRAKYTKVQSELRSLTVALESYAVDWNGQYPLDANESPTPYSPVVRADQDGMDYFSFMALTTPVAFMSEVPRDFFQDNRPMGAIPQANGVPYLTYNYHESVSLKSNPGSGSGDNNAGAILERYGIRWVVFGIGPDETWQIETMINFQIIQSLISSKNGGSAFSYSPTNGTRSRGDIMRSNSTVN
jgi:prepilin-type N-terminal cleavage/methylation domain-containing protein